MELNVFSVSDVNANISLIFGLCLMLGVFGGIIASRLHWMPTITAFMLLGLAAGPHGMGFISDGMLSDSIIFVDIALGLILYKLGTMLHPKAMIRSKRIMMLSLFESFLSFVLVLWGGMFLGFGALASAFVAAIAVSSSPAVLVHVAEEMHAKGPVSDRAKSLVAINNLLAFLFFSMALPFGMAGDDGGSMIDVIGLPIYRLAGAAVVGISVAWAAARIAALLRDEDSHYNFAIVIGAVMVTLGLSNMLGMSSLLATLVLGVAVRWFEIPGHNLSKVGLGEGGDLFFIVLFVVAGAKIDFRELANLGWIAAILVALRIVGKVVGVFTAGAMNTMTIKQSFSTSLMLIPMAGMAIGLVTTTKSLAPELGIKISTLVFAMVAVFETIGPFLVAYALRLIGEAGQDAEAPPAQESTL